MGDSDHETDEITIPRAAMNKMIKELCPQIRVANEARYGIFLTFPACFLIPIICFNLKFNRSNGLDVRNLEEKVKKASYFKENLTFHCSNKLFTKVFQH